MGKRAVKVASTKCQEKNAIFRATTTIPEWKPYLYCCIWASLRGQVITTCIAIIKTTIRITVFF